PGTGDRLFKLLPGKIRPRNAGDKIGKAAEVIGLPTPDAIYKRLISHWPSTASIVLGATVTETEGDPALHTISDFTQRMMYSDLVGYLPDDILVKVDRASMAVSLESREPLLAHRLIEFAWRLPLRPKLRRASGKGLLRLGLSRCVHERALEA